MKRIHILKMNNYVKPDPQALLMQSNKWITNGVNNDYFLTVEASYLGSPTNQSIIDNYVNYILGEGLSDENGLYDVESIFSEEDQRLAITDFKLQGACALQVIYNFGGGIAKLYYVPTKSIAVNKEPDITDDIKSYWYSFDWRYRTKYRPIEIPAFGCGDGLETEILYIKRHSPQPIFALPDWQSGIQYCQTEEELSNYYISHIRNNFSAGKVVNINQGTTDSEEAMDETRTAIINKLSGSSNAGSIIVAFNDNVENKTTVDTIPVEDAFSQFQFLSQECVEKIMLAHKVNDKSLFGLPMPSGFSSVAEQMVQSLKILYRSQINPIRRLLIKGLEPAFKKNDPNIKLIFTDFEELRIDNTKALPVTQSSIKMDANKVSFDFDETLTTDNGLSALRQAQNDGKTIYIISARNDDKELLDFAERNGIDKDKVFATGSNKAKIEKVLELNIGTHYDNNLDVVNGLPGIGKDINK